MNRIPQQLASGALAFLLSCTANAASISSTVAESNTQQQVSSVMPGQLTGATPYTFSSSLSSITSIQITLTLIDGDTAIGDQTAGQPDFDRDHLFLGLDGINTGIALNGFHGNALQDTLTISATISQTLSDALIAQFADKQFVGTIISDRVNSAVSPNDMFVGNQNSNAMTTLTLVGVPEPASVALLTAGLLLIIAPRVRRFRRNI
ncbi:MAG: hypothetical protein JWO45_888 [Spartobacteria bacterium]|nr:hypothetical protein [Spartobacteria bacterium]